MNHGLRSALVLAGTRSDLTLIACQLLSARGLRASVAGVPPSRLLKLSRSCAGAAVIAQTREELEAAGPRVIEGALAAARSCSADLVFAADVPGAVLAGRLKPHMPRTAFFPFPEEGSLRRLEDKWAFYRLVQELGLPTPRTWRLERAADAAGLTLPLMLKAPDLAGGRGIHRVQDAATRDALLGGSDPNLRYPMLAQEFLPGGDVGLSLLAHEGRLVSWCVQAHRSTGTDFILDERVVEMGRRIVEATRYSGLANIDMLYEDESRSAAKLIEFNPRFWLSIHRSLGLAVDFLGRGLALAVGAAPDPFREETTGSCETLWRVAQRKLAGSALTGCDQALWGLAQSDPVPFTVRVLQSRLAGLGGRGYV